MTDQISSDVTSDDRLWAFLAYIFAPLVPIIILLMEDKKDRPFIKAHNVQAMIWGVINLVIGPVSSSVFLCIPFVLIWGIGVYWGYKAYQGEMVAIPVITDFVKNQGWA